MKKTTVDNKDNRFELLKELLLADDRKDFKFFKKKFLRVRKFKLKVDPVIDEKIEDLKENFPEYFGDTYYRNYKSSN